VCAARIYAVVPFSFSLLLFPPLFLPLYHPSYRLRERRFVCKIALTNARIPLLLLPRVLPSKVPVWASRGARARHRASDSSLRRFLHLPPSLSASLDFSSGSRNSLELCPSSVCVCVCVYMCVCVYTIIYLVLVLSAPSPSSRERRSGSSSLPHPPILSSLSSLLVHSPIFARLNRARHDGDCRPVS